MTKLIGDDFVTIANLLGYNFEKGFCKGFTSLFCYLILNNQDNILYETLKFIEEYNKDFEKLNADIEQLKDKIKRLTQQKIKINLSKNEIKLINIPSIFNSLELYLNPEDHLDFFHDYINQNDTDTIYHLIDQTPENNPIEIIFNNNCVFTKEVLINFLNDAKCLSNKYNASIAIMLDSLDHSIAITFKGDSCLVVDTNDFAHYPDNKEYYRVINNTEDVCKAIMHGFYNKNVKYSLFNPDIS